MQIPRSRIAAIAAGATLAGGLAAGGVALAAGGGSGAGGTDPAQSLADALNTEAGTSITAAQVQAAFKDLLKARLDQAVAAGRLTQAQENQILQSFDQTGGFPGPPSLGPGPHFGAGKGAVLDAAATTLNLTEDALRAQLRAGKTLAQVAQAQNVSRDTLVAAIVKALKIDRPSLTDAQATTMANAIVDGTLPRLRGAHAGWRARGVPWLGPLYGP